MDIIKSFILEDGLFRGHLIAADSVVQTIWEKHGYLNKLRPIFSEAVVLALALSAGIKYDGVFSLQVKGKGAVSSLFVDVTTDKKVRGYMVYDDDAVQALSGALTVPTLFQEGQLIFSVAGVGQEPYQGVVALTHDSLTEIVADYFELSEQIKTCLIVRHDAENGRALMLQQMPAKTDVDADTAADLWETVQVLANSVQDKELFSNTLTADEILFRLFHANKLQTFDKKVPSFECRCYRGRMEKFLKKMTPMERSGLYRDGQIVTVCQFCGEVYSFSKKDLGDEA